MGLLRNIMLAIYPLGVYNGIDLDRAGSVFLKCYGCCRGGR